MNRLLRHGDVNPSTDLWTTVVGPLDQLTARRLDEPVEVVRAVDYDAFPFLSDPSANLPALSGRVLDDPGFMSTSALPSPRGGFADKPIEMRMHLPAGTRAGRLDSYGPEFAAERELLLARGTAYIVHRVYRERDRWVMECEVLPDE